ncbi:SOS response-associated peptidase [Aminobacter niigataensis]|uniref:SOS response-associated peptidase n=1 Tax=Aminobacter niigataensis TaxID=83265 RepID=UPI0024CA9F46|nr:SOS response-associated peptidase [Aminobacter niigataensis]CAI2935547.1 Abasic site processing protein [Aminobacter niigataensis]
MCGRIAVIASPEETAAFVGIGELESFPPRYNVAPTQPILVVMAGPQRPPGSNLPDRMAMLARWGLIPGWTKNPADMPLLFNARSESAIEKASFKTAMRHRRALIPVSGFYEWKKLPGNRRQPYWLRPRKGGLVALAGLMETWSEPGGSEIDTAAILTTGASADILHIHDRMPVVIQPEDFARWLDCRTQEPRDVAELMRPAQPDFFEQIPVSEMVNKVANVGPEIQDRVEPLPEAAPELAAKPKVEKRKSSDDDQMKLF